MPTHHVLLVGRDPQVLRRVCFGRADVVDLKTSGVSSGRQSKRNPVLVVANAVDDDYPIPQTALSTSAFFGVLLVPRQRVLGRREITRWAAAPVQAPSSFVKPKAALQVLDCREWSVLVRFHGTS